MKTLLNTPATDAFYMPAEFQPHAGCWMLWPERGDTWRLGAQPAQQAFASVAAAIATCEPVRVGVSRDHYQHARHLLPESVRVIELSHDDAWVRDTGPTFVVNKEGSVRGVDWMFNAWGGVAEGLYFPWDQDELVARKILELETCDRYCAPFVLEGGAVHVDGQGTALVTESCLLNPNRNPQLDQGRIELLLAEYLGVTTVIWLGQGLYADETGGHVDNLCCFVRPGEVLLTWTQNKKDPQYAISKDAYERLLSARDARGRRLLVHKIPQPGPLYLTKEETVGLQRSEHAKLRRASDRLAASYTNFYIANKAIIVPLLDKKHDRTALKVLKKLFPQRAVMGVQSREIVLGGGGIHCITQQIPLCQTPIKKRGRARK